MDDVHEVDGVDGANEKRPDRPPRRSRPLRPLLLVLALLAAHDLAVPAGRGLAARAAVFAIDQGDHPLVWQTTSAHTGDDWVWWFDQGKVDTAAGLACEMASAAVDHFLLAPAAMPRDLARANNVPQLQREKPRRFAETHQKVARSDVP